MPDELKPTLVWQGSSATIRCGVSWLTISGKDLPTLRLRGKEQLDELCRTLADALAAQKARGRFRREVAAGSQGITVITTTDSRFRVNIGNILQETMSHAVLRANFHSIESEIIFDLQRWLAFATEGWQGLTTEEYYSSAAAECCQFDGVVRSPDGIRLCLTSKSVKVQLEIDAPDKTIATILRVIGGEPDSSPGEDYLDSINLEKQQARLEFSQQGAGYAVRYRPNAAAAGSVLFFYLSSTLAEMAIAIHDRLAGNGKPETAS